MATQKPISTISYNTEAFLREKLDTWVQSHIIQAYQYIKHKGEDGDKDHIHVRVEPNKKLDPMDLTESLKEFVKDNDKPLGVRPWRSSKEEDWFLYAVHNSDYLALKYGGGEKGEKIPYTWQDIRVSADYDVEIAFTRALASMQHSTVNMAKQLSQGANPIELIMTGENVYMVNALARALASNDYERLARENRALKLKLNSLISEIERYGKKLGIYVFDDGERFYLSTVDHSTGEIIDSEDESR